MPEWYERRGEGVEGEGEMQEEESRGGEKEINQFQYSLAERKERSLVQD
jgi:hypothetical protein